MTGVPDEIFDRDSYTNHILLCSTCHTVIDKTPADHPPQVLREWKQRHEAWVTEQLERAMGYISFRELETVCEGVASSELGEEVLDLSLLPPLEKMQKNGLTERMRSVLSMGLSQAAHVREFLSDVEEVEDDFPERLVHGFRTQYYLGLSKGLTGDELFQHLSTHQSTDLSLQAAQLAVTSYLFHACDIFES